MNDFCTICPEDCSTASVVLPVIETDQQCAHLERLLTEICDIYIKPTGVTTEPTAFDTASMLTYLNAEVDNTNNDNTKIKHLVVIGDMPAPEKTEISLPKGKTLSSERTYTINADWTVGPDSHYTFAKALQCGDTSFTFWFTDRGGKMYGGIEGITPSKVDVDMVKERGDEGYAKALIALLFKACGDPLRIDDPYAG